MQNVADESLKVKPSDIKVCDESIAVEFGQMGKMEYGEIAYLILSLSQKSGKDDWLGVPYGVLLRNFQQYVITMVDEGWLKVDTETSTATLTLKTIEFMKNHS